jgi:hypothetical protein
MDKDLMGLGGIYCFCSKTRLGVCGVASSSLDLLGLKLFLLTRLVFEQSFNSVFCFYDALSQPTKNIMAYSYCNLLDVA